MFIISICLNYTVELNNNDCMKSYVKELKKDPKTIGNYYKTPYGGYHIDVLEFKEYEKIWIANGCLITPINNNYIIENIFNSIYCYTTFLIN